MDLKKALKDPKYLQPLAVIAILIVGVLVAGLHSGGSTKKQSACGLYRIDKTVTIGSQKIDAEVVSSPADQTKGLSGRPCIGPNQGMLFVYNQAGYYAFWMKDMKFAIDIIWISSDHKTAGVERSVQPSSYPGSKFINDRHHPAQYVLELKENRSSSLGITLGTPVKF